MEEKLTDKSQRGYVACCGSPFCRYPGRLWAPGIMENQRLCVECFAKDVKSVRGVPNWELGVPQRGKFEGL